MHVDHDNIQIGENDAIDVTLHLVQRKINLTIIYRQPSTNRNLFIKELKKLLQKKECSKDTEKIFMGDLNLNTLTETQNENERNDIEKFENLIAYYGYSQQINTATREEIRGNRITKSCLDLIFTKVKNFECKGYVVTLKPADHYYTAVEMLCHDKLKPESCPYNNKNIKSLNKKKIISELKNQNWNILTNINNPIEIYDIIEKTVMDIYKKNCSNKRNNEKNNNNNNKPRNEWMNEDLLKQINKKNKLWNKIKNLENVTTEQKNEYKKAKTEVKKKSLK